MHPEPSECPRVFSPVTALVVVGRLSRSFLTAVTPIPYSVPGLRSAQHKCGTSKHWGAAIKKKPASCLVWANSQRCQQMRRVVKWPAGSANGSGATKRFLVPWLHNRLEPNCISWCACVHCGTSVLYLHWWMYRALVVEQKHFLLSYWRLQGLFGLYNQALSHTDRL